MPELAGDTSMQIPTPFHGTWRGQVINDELRVHSYPGEIVVDVGNIQTRYEMKRGEKCGEITMVDVSEQSVMLKEIVGAWQGKLQLSLDSEGNMKCVWRVGSRQTAGSTMTRV